MKAIVNEAKKFNAAISGAGAHDSRALENIFEKCRHDKKKMTCSRKKKRDPGKPRATRCT